MEPVANCEDQIHCRGRTGRRASRGDGAGVGRRDGTVRSGRPVGLPVKRENKGLACEHTFNGRCEVLCGVFEKFERKSGQFKLSSIAI